jgi:hypothetical protein
MMTDAELLSKLLRHLSFRLVPNENGTMQLGLALSIPRTLLAKPWTSVEDIKDIVEQSERYSPFGGVEPKHGLAKKGH